jgi:hypothetical protein
MEEISEKVATHEATRTQMNERLGHIETRLHGIEARLSGLGHVGGGSPKRLSPVALVPLGHGELCVR